MAEAGYQITQKGEAFRGHDISTNSLPDLIVKLATTPGLYVRCSLGVSRASCSVRARQRGGAVATEDLTAAISYAFRNAKALGVELRDGICYVAHDVRSARAVRPG